MQVPGADEFVQSQAKLKEIIRSNVVSRQVCFVRNQIVHLPELMEFCALKCVAKSVFAVLIYMCVCIIWIVPHYACTYP